MTAEPMERTSTAAAAASLVTRAFSSNSWVARSTRVSSALLRISAKKTSSTQKMSVTFSASPSGSPLPTRPTRMAETTWTFMFGWCTTVWTSPFQACRAEDQKPVASAGRVGRLAERDWGRARSSASGSGTELQSAGREAVNASPRER